MVRPLVLLLCLLCLLSLVSATGANQANYIASRLRAPFHYLTCRSARLITPEHAVYFETREQAIEAWQFGLISKYFCL